MTRYVINTIFPNVTYHNYRNLEILNMGNFSLTSINATTPAMILNDVSTNVHVVQKERPNAIVANNVVTRIGENSVIVVNKDQDVIMKRYININPSSIILSN
ncbi:hypothetical protein PGAL8A_00508700 [Plasmodium gallinaceum]|uniref:Uncharacterized protein n=1 Tax=Plasmodium gallinaceum TaxID=5849 RepID=A0A1J1GY74_PLAGA|nr:hypothetical protein PGAL8A_00508700 [Plasmodium gallinaceum]CRG97514.1 hypothetical protein PGAL8A_00508700 [Plasmodium gallinaceum]